MKYYYALFACMIPLLLNASDINFKTDNYEYGMISGLVKGVYTDQPDSVFIITHLGMYRASVETNGGGINLFPGIDWGGSIKSVSGTAMDDIFYGGGLGVMWHYNGKSVHFYTEMHDEETLFGIDSNQSIVCAV